MKNLTFSIITASVISVFSFTSCKDDYTLLIQKIESTQIELQKEDSALTTQRNEIAKLVYSDTTSRSEAVSPEEMALTNLAGEQNTLITRLEIIIQKNKELIAQLNDNSADPKEVEKEFASHQDELELMKPEINAVKESYEAFVKEKGETLQSIGDTTKVK